jgi:hypothetical protein
MRDASRATRPGAPAFDANETLLDGYRMAALTNNPLAVVRAQLGDAGLTPLFDEVLSARGQLALLTVDMLKSATRNGGIAVRVK